MVLKRLLVILVLAGIALTQSDDKAKDNEQHKNDFISFDHNQDGNVDAAEVRTVFPQISQEELSAFFIATDKNENGLIDYDEYLHASLEHADGNLNLDDLQIS
ncbi:troponin skeletal muscle [Stylonychia lemnae]|uniref:Troponin skeletal muscle n=1 Tax=Stylonychia lemnae TaxID=5949 RepID=A0A078ATJ9_STYLE|nr:troponin skeletal muscle [Stylonychia lemnae]|eukprot:CDW84522.1 troponin skeletal muscle [Stylonychia lemnae]